MPNYIVPLDIIGAQLWTEVRRYALETGQPSRPEVTVNIFREVLSQCLLAIDYDAQVTAANLYGVPDWRTIHYREEPVDYEKVESFKGTARAFGLQLWHRLREYEVLQPDHRCILESCDSSTAIIIVAQDADYL